MLALSDVWVSQLPMASHVGLRRGAGQGARGGRRADGRPFLEHGVQPFKAGQRRLPCAGHIADPAHRFEHQRHRREERHELAHGLGAVDDLQPAVGQHADAGRGLGHRRGRLPRASWHSSNLPPTRRAGEGKHGTRSRLSGFMSSCAIDVRHVAKSSWYSIIVTIVCRCTAHRGEGTDSLMRSLMHHRIVRLRGRSGRLLWPGSSTTPARPPPSTTPSRGRRRARPY